VTVLEQLDLTYRNPAKLVPYANNSRKHSDEQINQIASSIKEFGFLQPVLVDAGGGIVAGHARVAAAQRLKLERVPTISVEHLTEAQIKLFVIADNRLAEQSTWDQEILKLELATLEELGCDFAWLDLPELFTPEQLEPKEKGDENEETEIVVDPVVKPGDLWRCGRHLVLCGDSTNPQHVELVLGGEKPKLCVTDPPYGVEYDANWRNEALGPGAARSVGKVENDEKVVWTDALSLFPGDVFYVWHADRHATDVALSLKDLDFEIRNQVIWAKNNFAISRGHYHWKHEPCWYAVKKGQRSNWKGDRSSTTLWEVPMISKKAAPEDQKTGHSTQKPVELFARPYRNHCEKGEHVYEPFLGSGTALIAAELVGLTCHGIEISPGHVEALLVRFRNYTKTEPVHVDSGVTLAELQASRGAP
jgi:DNA modification methylase